MGAWDGDPMQWGFGAELLDRGPAETLSAFWTSTKVANLPTFIKFFSTQEAWQICISLNTPLAIGQHN